MSGVNIMQASREWASRPNDQRFLTMDDLAKSVQSRRESSWASVTPAGRISVKPDGDRLALEVWDRAGNETYKADPTHWSFGQLASYGGVPAGYLRKIPSELAAINLQWGLEHETPKEDAMVLMEDKYGGTRLRSVTSPTYGRIWDAQVVEAVRRADPNGRWQVPSASYSKADPKRATTLYASDRDVFIFLVDPKNPVEVDGEQLFRGFYAWNSEVGKCVFGLCTFLYRYICDNRIIWGASEVRELRIKHSSGAPERFAAEGSRLLTRYASESTKELVAGIKAAKEKEVPIEFEEHKDKENNNKIVDWLAKRGFTKAAAKASVDAAQAEEGQVRSVWDVIQGVTAHARSVQYTDERTDMETKAGKLMDLAV